MQQNRDQVEGRLRVLQGTAREVVGAALGDRRMKIRGRFEKALGVFQARMGDAWHDIRDDEKAR